MVTIDQIIEYFEKTIAQEVLVGDKIGLRRLQTAAGALMAAAEANGDKDTAHRFRIVASHAANKIEELESHG